MARHDADRNLLLGILAHQMDFVSRDALFGAMVAWTLRKATPLGALLVERGDLAEARRSLLEALVDEHIRAHGGDPARSLEALSSVGPVVEDLARVEDRELRASVGLLRIPGTQSIPPSADPFATRRPESLGLPTSWNGRFRVFRPHARGGLGIVSIALDEELDREVALKEIKPEHADHAGSRARFVLEAELTGKLEHPGIIPVYGLGHDPAGRPFYAMRFIRGDSLAEAIDRYHDPAGPYTDPARRVLQLRELLGRFLDVCDALSYAHSRGVLHRDLKPGNVMLGPFGETLVVDWGLALPLERVPEGLDSAEGAVRATKADSGSLPREQGAVIGTPAYMPPEQAAGDLDKLGPRSDVYGLGAILYELLTGRRPVEGRSLEEILHRVGRGKITPPRQIRAEIAPPLEAVCLKALGTRPEDRYATPRALAADIKAWLADEPVSARRETLTERGRRWARRHQAAAAGTVATLVAGMIGLGGIAAVQTKARADLSLAYGDIDRKNGELTAANRALDRQRNRAEDRESEAIAAIRKFRDVVVNEPTLKDTTALTELRRRLLKEPRAFFRDFRDRLLEDNDTRPESLMLLAGADFELAELTDEIGDKRDAMRSCQESMAIYQQLWQSDGASPVYRLKLAAVLNKVGVLNLGIGDVRGAHEAFQRGSEILQSLVDDYPAITDYREALAMLLNNIATNIREADPRKSLAAHERVRELRQALVDAHPSTQEYRSGLAQSLHNVGILLDDLGETTKAIATLERARDLYRGVADAQPEVAECRNQLATTIYAIGHILNVEGDLPRAADSLEESRAMYQSLVDAHPAVTEYRSNLARSLLGIGVLQSNRREYAKALGTVDLACGIYQALADSNDSVVEYKFGIIFCRSQLGEIHRWSGDFGQAMGEYEQALAMNRRLVAEMPEAPQYKKQIAAILTNMGYVDIRQGRRLRGLGRLQEALKYWKEPFRTNPNDPEFRSGLREIGRELLGPKNSQTTRSDGESDREQ